MVAQRVEPRRTVCGGKPLAAGWTGKLWAMKQGVDEANARAPKYLLFTDADIVYDSDALTRLVYEAEANSLVLNSLMVKLRCESFAERMLIPAFIFFFQMLYPFAWANRPAAATAAAAGGCMLARRDALHAAGGIEGIRGALIDDCALAASLKRQGPIRLSLTDRVRSIRGYPDFQDIRRMVSRSAYAQLRYSPVLLAGMVIGMALTYLAPVAFTLFGHGIAQVLGLVTWVLMAIAFIIIFFCSRVFALKAQDRVIRLEERLRLSQLAPDLGARFDEFTVDQLCALRFASDEELPRMAMFAMNWVVWKNL